LNFIISGFYDADSFEVTGNIFQDDSPPGVISHVHFVRLVRWRFYTATETLFHWEPIDEHGLKLIREWLSDRGFTVRRRVYPK
jgi:hypothetical protein